MADLASDRIVIGADQASVMAVIADFASYPEWVDMVTATEVTATGPDGRAGEVRFDLDAGILKDEYVLAYDWAGDQRVTWHLVHSKALKAQDGSYELEPADGGTAVTYRLSVDLKMPVLGAFKRKAEKVIIESALRGLKKRVESGG